MLNRIWWNFTWSKNSTSSAKLVFFGSFQNSRWLPLPLIYWDIFNFFSATAEQNLMKHVSMQDLNVIYQLYVFHITALASDWLRHFQLFLNCWREFKETWQEACTQHPLPSLFFGFSDFSVRTIPKWGTQVHVRSPFDLLFYLGIEFYLFVSHGGMNDRGSMCKFRNARSTFWNLQVDPLSFIPPWETNK